MVDEAGRTVPGRSRWRPRARRWLLALSGSLLAALLGTCHRPVPPVISPVVDGGSDRGHRARVVLPAQVAAEPVAAPPAADQAPAAADPAGARGAKPEPPRLPARIRVGLVTDREEHLLPCCDQVELVAEDGSATTVRPGPAGVRLRPVLGPGARVVYRIQVGALREERQAALFAQRLRSAGVEPAGALFDAGRNFYRIRGGAFARREEADAALRAEPFRSFDQSHVVRESEEVGTAAFELVESAHRRLAGRALRVYGPRNEFTFERVRYRGRLLLFINERGLINVVDELALEDYLRGVLPREMGPELYPQLDALKALAVAARTYAVRNLGQFELEGYDICATPRCQVYGGIEAEHERSNRAVEETAGQVLLYRGAPIDSLYTASCGGRTENQTAVFPNKAPEPYLRGVSCPEGGLIHLAAPRPAARSFAAEIARVLGVGSGPAAPAEFEQRLRRLAEAAGLPPADTTLRSLAANEVTRFVRAAFDLKLERAALSGGPGDLPWLGEWGGEEADLDRLVLELARMLDLVDWRSVALLGLHDGSLELRDGRDHLRLALDPHHHVLVPRGGELVPAALDLLPGQPLEIVVDQGRVLAVIGHPALGAESSDPALHSRQAREWTRFRSDQELVRLVDLRYPGFSVRTLEVQGRSESGRVTRVLLVGAEERLELAGLDIRFTLDLPENQFSLARHTTSDGRSGYLFRGRGQGHGVGLCQVGSHALAEQGRDYREILHHYYADVVLGRLAVAPDTAAAGSRISSR